MKITLADVLPVFKQQQISETFITSLLNNGFQIDNELTNEFTQIYLHSERRICFIASKGINTIFETKVKQANQLGLLEKLAEYGNIIMEATAEFKRRDKEFKQLYNCLKTTYSDHNFILCGFSMGGYLVTKYCHDEDTVYTYNPMLVVKQGTNIHNYRASNDILSMFSDEHSTNLDINGNIIDRLALCFGDDFWFSHRSTSYLEQARKIVILLW